MSSARNATTRTLGNVARNTASLLTSDVLNKATTFVVYALVARYADARAFGQLSLGLLLLYTFQVFACGGLPTLITRQLATRRRRTARYLMAGSFVVACTSVLATLVMLLFPALLRYDRDTATVICILSLSLAPQALSTVAESVFRAWERMHYIAYANVPANVIKTIAAFLLLRNGYGVIAISVLLVACRLLVLGVEWALLAANLPQLDLRVDLAGARRLAVAGMTFLGMDGLIAIWGSLDAVLISKMCGEADVGLYSAAWQLLVPASLLFQSIVGSLFPMMCQKVRTDPAALRDFVGWLLEFLSFVGFPIAVGLYFLAEPCLLLLYRDAEFLSAASIVRVLVFVLLLQTATSVLGHALWARLQERVTLRIVAVNVMVNLLASAVMIYFFGVVGAAIASVVTWSVNALQHYVAYSRLHGKIPIVATMWKAAAASLLMATCFVALRGASVWVAAGTASLVYLAVAVALLIATCGGFKELRAGYFSPLTE